MIPCYLTPRKCVKCDIDISHFPGELCHDCLDQEWHTESERSKCFNETEPCLNCLAPEIRSKIDFIDKEGDDAIMLYSFQLDEDAPSTPVNALSGGDNSNIDPPEKPYSSVEQDLGIPFLKQFGENFLAQEDLLLREKCKRLQREDKYLNALINLIEKNELSDEPDLAAFAISWRPRCTIDAGVLYYTPDINQLEPQRVCIPQDMRKPLLQEQFHTGNIGGHFSSDRTYEKLIKNYWWPDMRKDVLEYVANCWECATRRPQGRHWLPPSQGMPIPAMFNELVGIDLCKMPKSEQGNTYVMVVTDILTRFASVYAIKQKAATTVAWTFYSQYCTAQGPPKAVLTDQGTEFTNRLFKEMSKLLGIQTKTTTAFYPQGNAITERFNRTMLDYLAKKCVTGTHCWEVHLPALVLAYNSTVHRGTKLPPYEAARGIPMNVPSDIPFVALKNNDCNLGDLQELPSIIRHTWRQAADHLLKYNEQRNRYGNRDKTDIRYEIGDHVWIHGGTYDKLGRPCSGPYEIIRIYSNGTAKLKWVKPYTHKVEEKLINMSKLIPCRRTDYTQEWNPNTVVYKPQKPSFPDSFRKRKLYARNFADLSHLNPKSVNKVFYSKK